MDLFQYQALIVSGVTTILIITIFMLIVATAIVMLVLIHQKKQVQYLREKEQLKILFEKEILESKLEIQEQTLKNVSQELHDNIGQVLGLVKLNINTMDCNAPLKMQEKIEDSSTLVGKAIQDIRDLSRSLNTDYVLSMGLVKSVDYELELIKRTGSYKTMLQIEGQPFRLQDQQELILFRIVQEALQNIMRHAMAGEMNVCMMFDSENFILTIKDDGIGIEKSLLDDNDFKNTGLGLRNMHNRAKIINAKMLIEKPVEKGTLITVTLPLTRLN